LKTLLDSLEQGLEQKFKAFSANLEKGLQGNLVLYTPEFELIGPGKVEGGLLTKVVGTDDWTTLYVFKEVLNSGVWEFDIKVHTISSDKSGLVMGFFNGDNKDTKLDYINSKILGLNFASGGYNYKMNLFLNS